MEKLKIYSNSSRDTAEIGLSLFVQVSVCKRVYVKDW